MPRALKPDEAALERLFVGDAKSEEVANAALDCLVLAAKADKASVQAYYGVVRESHLWWAEHSANEELLDSFNAVGEYCVSLAEGEELDMAEFGVE
ncbi:hypothetical protein SS50377_24179 [Spironucleus salmonicida]|nr:hypothetical protein SS50377_24179 [Spironucleus salmonicida]